MERILSINECHVEREKLMRQKKVHSKDSRETRFKGRSQKEVELIAAGVAHSFNNLLAIILGQSELGLDSPSDEAICRYAFNQIRQAAFRGRDIVRQLLLYAGPLDPHHGAFHLAPLVRETAELLQVASLCTIQTVLHVDETNDVVEGNAHEIREMLMNICTNAAEVMEGKGGELRIELIDGEYLHADSRETGSQQECLSIKITDAGGGMSGETQKRAFDPFFTTSPDRRSGMGLTVARAIVRRHSGTISFRSSIGEGTTFVVTLPRAAARSSDRSGGR